MDKVTTMNARVFGHMLQTMREARLWSRAELASKAGLTVKEIIKIEKGSLAITRAIKSQLENAYGHTLYSLPHKQVLLRVGVHEAEIDEKIVPLIRELWLADIKTSMSCQQGVWGLVWVEFYDTQNLERFLDIVAEYDPGINSLYRRIYPTRHNPGPLPDWQYDISVADASLADGNSPEEDHYDSPAMFYCAASVRFPLQDLAHVTRRMKRHNRVCQRQLAALSASDHP